MKNHPDDRRSLLMFISSMLIFGTIGLFRRLLPLSSGFLAFSRGIAGGLFLLLFMKLGKRDPGERMPARTRILLAVSGAVMGINWILLFEAYTHTTVAVAILCYYMQPTIVMLLSPLLFREKFTLQKAICAAAAVAGMVLVSGVTGGGSPGAGNFKGILLGLCAALCYSTVIILNKKIPGVDPYRKTTLQLFSAGLVMVPYLFLTSGFPAGGFSLSTACILFIVCFVHTGIAYLLYFGSMDGLKVQSVALLSYIDPVSALLFAALFLREPMSLQGIIGAFLIIGSAAWAEIRPKAEAGSAS